MNTFDFEMHFHTKESSPCGKVPAKKGTELYIEAGYQGIIVTDHFSEYVNGGEETGHWEEKCETFLKGYHVAKESAQNIGLQILLGMEIRFPDCDNDFLVYGIEENFVRENPWIYMKDLSYLHDIAKEQNLLVVQAHPFRNSCFLASVDDLDGIEVFNGNPRSNSRNELALRAAEENHKMHFMGSDFHQLEDISGRPIVLSNMPKSGQELVELLKNR